MTKRISAIFESHAHAERAITELRGLGIGDEHLSIVSQHPEHRGGGGGVGVTERTTDKATGKDVATGAGKGLLGGVGVGALFGLAAALIPGVGPFVAAGALASALGAVGGAVAAGAIVGGTSGALAGALAEAGYHEHEARWFGSEVEQGRVMLVVEDTGGLIDEARIREVFARHGGRNPSGAWT